MGGGVEVPVPGGRLVQHLDIAVVGRAPVDERPQRRGVRLEHPAVVIEAAEDGGADREDEAGRVVAGRRQYVVDEPPVKPAVAVHEGVHVDEAERDDGSRHHRVHALVDGALRVVDDAADEVRKILGACADVLRERLPGQSVVRSTTLLPPAGRDGRIARRRSRAAGSRSSSARVRRRVPACPIASAQRAARAPDGRSPSMANDDFESFSSRKAAARATRSRWTRPMTSRARRSYPAAARRRAPGCAGPSGRNAGFRGGCWPRDGAKTGSARSAATCKPGSTTVTVRTLPGGSTSSSRPVSHS